MPRPRSISNDQLLDTVLEVIQKIGPERFTLRDISNEVSLSPATLLQRFGSKAELLKQAILHAKDKLKENLSHIENSISDDPKEALVQWLISITPFSHRESFASHLSLLKQDILDDEMREQSKLHINLIHENIVAYLTQLTPRSSKSDLMKWSKMIEAQWQGLLMQWVLGGEGELESCLREGLLLLLSYIASEV